MKVRLGETMHRRDWIFIFSSVSLYFVSLLLHTHRLELSGSLMWRFGAGKVMASMRLVQDCIQGKG